MEGEEFFGAAYKGTKQFTQQEVKTANATGFGAAADDYMERGIDLNEQLVHNKPATYFFRMKGDAMQEAGIFDGDTVLVERSSSLKDGDIVVALMEDGYTIKYLKKTTKGMYLEPANTKYRAIYPTEDNPIELVAKVKAVIRKF